MHPHSSHGFTEMSPYVIRMDRHHSCFWVQCQGFMFSTLASKCWSNASIQCFLFFCIAMKPHLHKQPTTVLFIHVFLLSITSKQLHHWRASPFGFEELSSFMVGFNIQCFAINRHCLQPPLLKPSTIHLFYKCILSFALKAVMTSLNSRPIRFSGILIVLGAGLKVNVLCSWTSDAHRCKHVHIHFTQALP